MSDEEKVKPTVVEFNQEEIVEVNTAGNVDNSVDEDGDVITDINKLTPDQLQRLWAILGASNNASSASMESAESGLGAFGSVFGTETSASAPVTLELPQIDESNQNGPYANKKGPIVNENNKNRHTIACPFCTKSVVFLPKVATLVEKDIFLMYPLAKQLSEGETYKHHWRVTSKMDFENITVRRGNDTEGFRYLTCGDCEKGPIGIVFNSDNNKVFYITDSRILYK